MILSDCQKYRIQRREVARVLLQGLSDEDSPLSMLAGIQEDVMRDIVWKKMVDIKKWQFYPDQ